jgi:GNAT superfamily N-acetyltransferase
LSFVLAFVMIERINPYVHCISKVVCHGLVDRGKKGVIMRIRNYREVDLPTLVDIQQLAAKTDSTEAMGAADFEEWLAQPELEAETNVFVITDDDESNEWGQAGTLEGVEGEVVGYTVVQLRYSQHAYHFLCEGAVHPAHRRRGAGRALLICGLNRARTWSAEFEFEAEEKESPIYFEALLPLRDPASDKLAAKWDMQSTNEPVLEGMKLYRREL